eukprot:2566026-Rhodomonas_salina.1
MSGTDLACVSGTELAYGATRHPYRARGGHGPRLRHAGTSPPETKQLVQIYPKTLCLLHRVGTALPPNTVHFGWYNPTRKHSTPLADRLVLVYGLMLWTWLYPVALSCGRDLILQPYPGDVTPLSLIRQEVDMVLTGAAGVCESGGIINKLGTYQMSVIAKEAKKPFY